MDSTTLTVLIAVAFLILAVIASWISARINQRDEPELIDFPGSGLLIKPRRKKERFSPEWWSNWIQGLSTELVGGMGLSDMYGLIRFVKFVRFADGFCESCDSLREKWRRWRR